MWTEPSTVNISMKTRPIGCTFVVLAVLGIAVVHLLLLVHVKRTSFPFVTMSYATSAEGFDSKQVDTSVPLSEDFKRRVAEDLGGEVEDRSDVLGVSSALAAYVRSQLFHEEGHVVRDVQAVLDSSGEDGALCSGYARLLVAAAQSLGYDARVVWMQGHTVSEVYFPDYGWVLVDSSGNLTFKDREGKCAGLLYVVENPDEAGPLRAADQTANDSDYLRSGGQAVYGNNPVLVVIEGPRLFDFDVRTRSPGPVLEYLVLGRPVAAGVQYIAGGRTRLGNLRRLVLPLLAFDVVIALVFIAQVARLRRPHAS